MGKRDQRVDEYIAKAPEFAQPILHEIRRRLHEAIAKLEEDIRENTAFFTHNGKVVASMAAFKKHAKLGVWINANKPEFIDIIAVDGLAAANTFFDRVKAAATQVANSAKGMRSKIEKMAGKKKPSAKKKAPATKKKAAKKKR